MTSKLSDVALLKNFSVSLTIIILFCLSIFNQAFPLWLSLILMCLVSMDLLSKSVRVYGLINPLNFFIVLFMTAVITLTPKCFDQNYVTGVHSIGYQTMELFQKVAQVSLLALLSMYWGWTLVPGSKATVKNEGMKIKMSNLDMFFWISLLMGFLFAFISLPSSTLFSATYGEIVRSDNSGLRAANALSLFGTTMAFYAYLMNPGRIKKYALYALFPLSFIYCGFLTGGRVEQFGCLVALIAIYQWKTGKRFSRKALFIVGGSLFLLLSVIGFVRSGNLGPSNIFEYFTSGRFLYTQKDIMTTALVVSGLEQDGIIQVDYGKTIFDVLVSVLPRNIDPSRPEQFDTKISEITQWPGGTFVINEPYIAGHVVGVFFLFLFLGMAFKKAEKLKFRFGESIIYLGVLCGMPRFVYYGWMPAYRFLTIAVLFAGIYWLLGYFSKKI
jgi:hypothetical protein